MVVCDEKDPAADCRRRFASVSGKCGLRLDKLPSDWVKDEAKSGPIAVFLKCQQATLRRISLAGAPAYRIAYTVTDERDSLKVTEIWSIKDGKKYIITCEQLPTTITSTKARHSR
jgi:hypothetical protein